MTNSKKTSKKEKPVRDYSIAITLGILIGFAFLAIGPSNEIGRGLDESLQDFVLSNKKEAKAKEVLQESVNDYDKLCIFLDDDSDLEVAEYNFQNEHRKHPGTKENDRNAIITLSNSSTGLIKTYLLDNIYISVKSDKYWLKFGEEQKHKGCLPYSNAKFKTFKSTLSNKLIMF